MRKKSIYLLFLVFFLVVSLLCAKAQEVTSEILNLRSEYNLLLIDIAKRYPTIEFEQNDNKMIIKFFNTKYHKTFDYTSELREALLNELSFLNNISIKLTNTLQGGENIEIELFEKENVSLKPKVKSTVGNVITVSFYPEESKLMEEIKPKLDMSKELEELSKEEQVVELYNNAVEEQVKNNLDKAEELYIKAVGLDSNFYLARYNLARIYLDKGILDKSVSVLESLVKDFGDNKKSIDKWLLSSVQNMLASIYYLSADFDNALKIYKDLIKENPGAELYYNIALVYEKLGKISEAKKNLKKSIDLNPKFPDAYFHEAMLALIKKKKKDAIVGFNKVLELAPGTEIAKLSKEELGKLEK